ncbi:hypothetical protein K488DRAFT_66248, partial [Vararia minispora EC-137]
KTVYKLRGIIYYGGAHFTSCIINKSGQVFYHDGIETGRRCVYQGTLSTIHNLQVYKDRRAIALIYSSI